jgi:hypothetical protein
MFFLIAWIYKKSELLKLTTMNKWTKKVSKSFLDRHYSNNNERIIPMKGGVPIRVAPKGMFIVGLITEYDELAFVDLRPKHLSVSISGSDQITTIDGVKIFGQVDITAKIFDNDRALIRLISNEEDEEKILISNLKKNIRNIISEKDWIDLTILKEDKYESIRRCIYKDMRGVNCCLYIDQVMFINLAPMDNEFANLLEQKRKEKEQSIINEEKEKSQQHKIKLQQGTEEIILEHERRKESDSNTHNIKLTADKSTADIERTNKEHAAELERKIKEDNARIELMREQAKLIKENIEILALINPAAYEQYKKVQIEEIIAKMKQGDKSVELLKQLVMKGLDAEHSEIKGMINITQPLVSALASKQLGIDVKFPEGTIKIEREDNTNVVSDDSKSDDELPNDQSIKENER